MHIFGGIREVNCGGVGQWHCYDTNIHAVFAFKDGEFKMIVQQYKPNPAGGWYKTDLIKQGVK